MIVTGTIKITWRMKLYAFFSLVAKKGVIFLTDKYYLEGDIEPKCPTCGKRDNVNRTSQSSTGNGKVNLKSLTKYSCESCNESFFYETKYL